MNLIPLLQQQVGTGGGWIMPVTVGLLFVIFYVFIILPQKKEQRKTQELIAGVQKGDKIITIGGIHGVISSVKDTTIILKVDENCKIEMNRTAIASVILDEKTKAKRQDAVSEKPPRFSLFGKKGSKQEDAASSTPQPPDFTGGTV